ncbi:ABC transporter substrate binding protein (PQQ-dependent alcohol dehydrogenase system) [Rhodanobacter sp. ANJX3]|uniref:ABC transporter substrate-binding protein n=1 Tax=Rhodanobacter sp. ANJX3 TaxID=2723083 RepID=UPI00161E7E7D|nr:ABC transporter substrate-binding protein [Rhodanobacter sp. ANJX3]MBB5359831.1 ABC transporter substrate binding protein (PQQ-dependent alcohol dehydrogenase system) [Rhodanobacter sp. ANJX3]
MRRRIAIIIAAVLASALAAAGSAAPVSKPASKQANKPAASSEAKSNEFVTHYAYLGKAYREPAPLSLLKPAVIPDEGLAGVRLGTNYNNQAGKFLDLKYVLDETMLPEDGDVVAAAKKLLAAGEHLIIADLKAPDLLAVADLPEAKNAIILNIRARDDVLRQTQCRVDVFHLIPSNAMLTDALAQYLVWKKWTRWFLVRGQHPEDVEYANDITRSAELYGAKIVAERAYELQTGARRVDTGYQEIQTQMPMLTRGVPDYDVAFVADETNSFGLYLQYRTTDPRPVVGTDGLEATAWGAAYESYAAETLHDDFLKLANREITVRDYEGWLAASLLEMAVKQGSARNVDAIRKYISADSLKLAGYKGESMNFRAWDNQLRQPILLMDQLSLVSVSPQPGFLHPVYNTDTLGVDQPQSQCKFAK